MTSQLDYQETLQQFVSLSARADLASQDKLEQLLKLGCAYLHMEVGIISKIQDNRYKILVAHSEAPNLRAGMEFKLEATFCAVTFTHENPQSVEHAGHDEFWHKHPAYLNTSLEAYIGIRLMVDRKPWGTINFSRAQPRARRFVPQDFTLLELMAQWVSHHYQQQRAQREQLRYFDLSLDPIADIDYDGHILRVNAAWKAMFAASAEQLSGRPLLDFIDRRDHDLIARSLKMAKEGTSTAQIEARTNQESLRWISWSVIPAHQQDRFVVVGRNVTMIKSIQHQLTQSKDEAEEARDEAVQANATKGRFLANASHEIRTPLNGIIGMTELLLDTNLTPRQRDYAEAIEQSAQSLQVIINDVLDLSKMESQTYQLRPERVRLRELISDVARSLSQAARRKGLELIWLVDPAIPRFIVADPVRLRQILINLTNNAIKFTQRGEVSLRALAPIHDGEQLVLSFEVRDTGPGIKPTQLPHLFEPFFRGSADANGTGLGLSICKQLIELMQGQLHVESVLGEGSTFSFQISAQASSGDDEPKTHTLFATEPRALLIEQDRNTSQELLQFLPTWGVQLQSVRPHPKDIVSMIERARSTLSPFHFIMLDSRMNQAEDLLQWISSDLRFRDMSIAWIEPFDDTNALASELAHIVITRPLQRDRLLAAMFSTLEEFSRPSLQEDSEIILLPSSTTQQERSVLLSVADDKTQGQVARVLSHYNIAVEITDNIEDTRQALRRHAYPLIILDLDQARVSELRTHLDESPLLTIIGLTRDPSAQRLNAEEVIVQPITDQRLHAALAPQLLSQGIINQVQLTRHDGSMVHVLVVEDQLINQRVVEGYLEKTGCKVTIANNGQEALTLTMEQRFDVILMDCQMPVMDGYEATRKIRQREQQHISGYTPIIALTAYAMEEDRLRALNAGMDEVLNKPIQREQLIKTLAKWIYHELDPHASGQHFIQTALLQHTSSPHIEQEQEGKQEQVDAPQAQPQRLDEATLQKLILDCQEISFVEELAADFITQSRQKLQTLASLLEAPTISASELGKLAHASKGSASIFGLSELVEQSRIIDDQCRAQVLSPQELYAYTLALQTCFTAALDALTLRLKL